MIESRYANGDFVSPYGSALRLWGGPYDDGGLPPVHQRQQQHVRPSYDIYRQQQTYEYQEPIDNSELYVDQTHRSWYGGTYSRNYKQTERRRMERLAQESILRKHEKEARQRQLREDSIQRQKCFEQRQQELERSEEERLKKALEHRKTQIHAYRPPRIVSAPPNVRHAEHLRKQSATTKPVAWPKQLPPLEGETKTSVNDQSSSYSSKLKSTSVIQLEPSRPEAWGLRKSAKATKDKHAKSEDASATPGSATNVMYSTASERTKPVKAVHDSKVSQRSARMRVHSQPQPPKEPPKPGHRRRSSAELYGVAKQPNIETTTKTSKGQSRSQCGCTPFAGDGAMEKDQVYIHNDDLLSSLSAPVLDKVMETKSNIKKPDFELDKLNGDLYTENEIFSDNDMDSLDDEDHQRFRALVAQGLSTVDSLDLELSNDSNTLSTARLRARREGVSALRKRVSFSKQDISMDDDALPHSASVSLIVHKPILKPSQADCDNNNKQQTPVFDARKTRPQPQDHSQQRSIISTPPLHPAQQVPFHYPSELELDTPDTSMDRPNTNEVIKMAKSFRGPDTYAPTRLVDGPPSGDINVTESGLWRRMNGVEDMKPNKSRVKKLTEEEMRVEASLDRLNERMMQLSRATSEIDIAPTTALKQQKVVPKQPLAGETMSLAQLRKHHSDGDLQQQHPKPDAQAPVAVPEARRRRLPQRGASTFHVTPRQKAMSMSALSGCAVMSRGGMSPYQQMHSYNYNAGLAPGVRLQPPPGRR